MSVRRAITLILALAMVLVTASIASAADFQIYGEYGFLADQYFMGEQLPSSIFDVTPWAVGGEAKFGPWVVGGDYRVCGIEAPFIGIDAIAYDVYGGYRLFDGKEFDVYGLIAYADYYGSLGGLKLSANGFAAGVLVEAKAGPVLIEGKVLTTLSGSASAGPMSFSGSLTIAEARCTLQLTDMVGVYGAYHYVGSTCEIMGMGFDAAHADWVAVGISLSF